MSPSEQDSGCSERPLEGGVADLGPRGPITLARRCSGAFHEAARGDARLHPRKAMDVMEFIEQDKGQDLTDPWDRAQAVEDLDIMCLRGMDERALDSGEKAVVGPEPREVHFEALLASGIGEALSDAVAVGLVGELLADLGHVILPVSMLDMRQQAARWRMSDMWRRRKSRVARISAR
jgi:hypothetical protein